MADSTTSRVSLTLDSTLESVGVLEKAAESWGRQAGFEGEEVSRIALSVREAAVNAVHHANGYDPGLQVSGDFELTPEALIVRIGDRGRGIDVDSIPDPLAPENILRGSGRGIFLMRAFMDKVQFRNTHPGTEITMTKNRKTS